MTLALGLILWALRIRNFEAVNDGVELIINYGEDWPTSEQFYEDRIADYAFASSTNRKLNTDTAASLARGSWCMAGGILYLLVIVLAAIWRAQWHR